MKRLTDEAWRNNDPWEMCQLGDDCKRKCVNSGVRCKVAVRLRRLAAYEDTGLEPEDFDKLCREMSRVRLEAVSYTHLRAHETVEADKDGRLFISPYKIGDTVYEIAQGYCDDEDCPDEYHDYVDDVYVDMITCTVWDNGTTEVKLNDYLPVEDAYATYAEAETALKGARENG